MLKALFLFFALVSSLVFGLEEFSYQKSFRNKYVGVASFEMTHHEQNSQKVYFSIFNHHAYLRYQVLHGDSSNVSYFSQVKILFVSAKDKKEFKAKLYNRTAHPAQLWIVEEQDKYLIVKNALVASDESYNPYKIPAKNDLAFLTADALVHVPELINSMSDKWLMPVKKDIFLSSPRMI